MRNMNMRAVIASVMVAAVLLLTLLGVALAADPTAEASRTINPKVVERGQVVQITVVFRNLLNVTRAFSLNESYPAGWTFTRGVDDASAFRPGPPPEWVWFGVGANVTKTVTYNLTVPMDAALGNYTIVGVVIGNNITNPVGGDTVITVTAMYNLTISSTSGGSVTTPGEGVFAYQAGTIVPLIASPDSGYRFVNWTGDVGTVSNASAASTSITMNGHYSITANFKQMPTVTTQAATAVATDSATLNMQYTVGGYSPVEVRFAYKKSADPTWSYTAWVSKTASGAHAASLSGLSSSTQYDFKAQLRYDSTVIEGAILKFTTGTPPVLPGGCFIATAAYGTPTAKQIDVLREFRDVVLLKSTVGSQFVALYYKFSPPVADFIAGHEVLRTMVRELLVEPVVRVIEATGHMWQN